MVIWGLGFGVLGGSNPRGKGFGVKILALEQRMHSG